MSTPPPTRFTEHVYATKHGVELPLRIWRCLDSPDPEDSNYADPMDSAFSVAASEQPPRTKKPWLLWSHGGGFMGGSLVPAPWVLPAFQTWAHVVSYGYRLAPHAGIDDMVDDGTDAFDWCRAHLPTLLDDIDIDAYAVGGLSAGGTLALLNARNLSPRPRAVLDVYGIADFGDPCFDPKFTGPGYDPGTVSGRYSEGELERAIADRDLRNAHTSLAGDEDPDAESTAQAWYKRVLEVLGAAVDKRALQQDVRVHVAATSRIMRVLTRRERFTNNDTWREHATSISPIALVDAHFPPTAILHGVADKVVPVDQSARLAQKLEDFGVQVTKIYAENRDHCFDFELIEPTFEAWQIYIDPIVSFVRDRVTQPRKTLEGAFGDKDVEDAVDHVAAAAANLAVKEEHAHVHWQDLDEAAARTGTTTPVAPPVLAVPPVAVAVAVAAVEPAAAVVTA